MVHTVTDLKGSNDMNETDHLLTSGGVTASLSVSRSCPVEQLARSKSNLGAGAVFL
jgi:hypothetical protein